MLKQKIKMTRRVERNVKKNFTITVWGRTEEELKGRVEKTIGRMLENGAELR